MINDKGVGNRTGEIYTQDCVKLAEFSEVHPAGVKGNNSMERRDILDIAHVPINTEADGYTMACVYISYQVSASNSSRAGSSIPGT